MSLPFAGDTHVPLYKADLGVGKEVGFTRPSQRIDHTGTVGR